MAVTARVEHVGSLLRPPYLMEARDRHARRELTAAEFKAIEDEYLPTSAGPARAVIIAAGSGKSLLPLTEDRPKCMLDIKGRTILERQVDTLRACGVALLAM